MLIINSSYTQNTYMSGYNPQQSNGRGPTQSSNERSPPQLLNPTLFENNEQASTPAERVNIQRIASDAATKFARQSITAKANALRDAVSPLTSTLPNFSFFNPESNQSNPAFSLGSRFLQQGGIGTRFTPGQDQFDASFNNTVSNLLNPQTENAAAENIIGESSKKVKLVPINDKAGGSVIFEFAPEMSKDKTVNYIPITELRQAAAIYIFIGTSGRTFTINAKLISRTIEEAEQNIQILNLLESWTNPEDNFGYLEGDTGTPMVLRLYGYGERLKGIPCVITSFSTPFPEDVDYIYTGSGDKTGIPIVQPVTISLQEVRTPDELDKFSIEAFRNGTLAGW